MTLNTWYRIRVTRTVTGVTTLYIKGCYFGTNDWTTAVAGGGANPYTDNTYTTCEYIYINTNRVGNRIANLICYDGIKQ